MNDATQLNEFLKQVLTYQKPESLREFLEGILTPKELSEIPTRLQIVKMLKQGTPQREIANELGVGIATVTRGSKELQRGKFSEIS